MAFIAVQLLWIDRIRLAQLDWSRGGSVGPLLLGLRAVLLVRLPLLVALARHAGIVFLHCGAEFLIRNQPLLKRKKSLDESVR